MIRLVLRNSFYKLIKLGYNKGWTLHLSYVVPCRGLDLTLRFFNLSVIITAALVEITFTITFCKITLPSYYYLLYVSMLYGCFIQVQGRKNSNDYHMKDILKFLAFDRFCMTSAKLQPSWNQEKQLSKKQKMNE